LKKNYIRNGRILTEEEFEEYVNTKIVPVIMSMLGEEQKTIEDHNGAIPVSERRRMKKESVDDFSGEDVEVLIQEKATYTFDNLEEALNDWEGMYPDEDEAIDIYEQEPEEMPYEDAFEYIKKSIKGSASELIDAKSVTYKVLKDSNSKKKLIHIIWELEDEFLAQSYLISINGQMLGERELKGLFNA